MENYLYFRKQRPVKASVTLGSATQTCPAFAVADIGVLANNDNENEIAAISITSLDGGGTGHASVLFDPTTIVPTLAYSTDARAIATSSVHWIEPSTQAYENGVLVLDAHGVAGGYTLDTGDIVTAYFKTGLETACMYPASSYLGAVAVDADTTTLHFKAILGTAADDYITVEHASGGFESLVQMMNDAVNGYPKEGKLVSVIDGSDGIMSTLNGNPAGVTSIEYVPQGGAAGMAT
jgi:hypothetical protein